MSQVIPEAAVEAAARKMFSKWGELPESSKEHLYPDVRAIVEAAAPHMLAAKVDEARANHAHIIPGGDGYSAGFHYALQCIYSGDE